MTLEDITNKQSYKNRWVPRIISSLATSNYKDLCKYRESIKNNLESDKMFIELILSKISNLDLTIEDVNVWLLENDISNYKPKGRITITTFTGKTIELGNYNETPI